VEWDFEYFNPKGSRTLVGAYAADAVPFAFTQSSSGSWLTTLRGRIGLAQNNWLLYLTGGVAAAQMSFNSTFLDQETSPPRFSGGLASTVWVSQTRYGAVGGAGFEYGFTPNWSVRADRQSRCQLSLRLLRPCVGCERLIYISAFKSPGLAGAFLI